MAANKVVLNGETILDLTGDNTYIEDVTIGKLFHKPNGVKAMGNRPIIPEYDGAYILGETNTIIKAGEYTLDDNLTEFVNGDLGFTCLFTEDENTYSLVGTGMYLANGYFSYYLTSCVINGVENGSGYNPVYYDNKWAKQGLRTIVVTNDTEVDEEFGSWFKEHTSQSESTSAVEIVYKDLTINLAEGQTVTLQTANTQTLENLIIRSNQAAGSIPEWDWSPDSYTITGG